MDDGVQRGAQHGVQMAGVDVVRHRREDAPGAPQRRIGVGLGLQLAHALGGLLPAHHQVVVDQVVDELAPPGLHLNDALHVQPRDLAGEHVVPGLGVAHHIGVLRAQEYGHGAEYRQQQVVPLHEEARLLLDRFPVVIHSAFSPPNFRLMTVISLSVPTRSGGP